MRGADVGSANADPLRIEPEVGQISENGSECSEKRSNASVSQIDLVGFQRAMGRGTRQSSHVLDHDERRPELGDRADDLGPETRAGPRRDPSAEPAVRDVLARETSGEHVARFHGGPVDA